MRIILFGLTGFGNAALRGCRGTADVVALFTRLEAGAFPYYPETTLAEEARAVGIPVTEDADPLSPVVASTLRARVPDLLLVATYHRRIPPDWIAAARLGAINLHPSLLPAYRGASPTVWCLVNGETQTGVTAHVLTEQIDAGPILLQRRVPVSQDDTDGTLRQKLAALTEDVTRDLVGRLGRGERLAATPQDELRRSIYPRRALGDAEITFDRDAVAVYNRIRANLPHPGPWAVIAGRRVRILGAEILVRAGGVEPAGRVKEAGSGDVLAHTRDGIVRLRIAADERMTE